MSTANTGKKNSIVLTQEPSFGYFRGISAALLLAAASGLRAQTATSVPVPSQLKTAQTAFVANAGGPVNYLNQEAYIDFYQALLTSKHFQLTEKPADAELALELSVTSHIADINGGSSSNLLVLCLNIRDVKSQSLLWSLTEPIKAGSLAAISSKNLAAAASDLVTDFNTLISGPLTNPLASKKARTSQEKQ